LNRLNRYPKNAYGQKIISYCCLKKENQIRKLFEVLPQSPARTQSGINPYAGPWGINEVVHLLKRTMFGAKKTDVDYFLTRNMNQAVDELLNPLAPDPTPPVKEYVTAATAANPDNNIAQGTTWINDINNDGVVQSQRISSYKKMVVGSYA
jgi:hypothetical protein